MLGISCESSAWQMIHMKCQALFSLKTKKIIKMLSGVIVISTLRVNLFVTTRLQIKKKTTSSKTRI